MRLQSGVRNFQHILKHYIRDCIPFSAILEVTYRCNLRCRHCYQVPRRGKELTVPENRRVLDQLADLGCMYVSFSGGEPLVRKDFFRIAQYAREKNFALRLMTNGALVDRRIARHLSELNFECVDVSIYGMNAATHDHFTGVRGSFRKTVAGIRHLKKAGIDVRLKMTINRYNASQLQAVKRLARNLGAEFQAEPYITPRNNFDRSPLAHRISRRQAESVARYVTSANAGYYRKEHGSVGSVCNAARCLMAISPFGDVYPCEGMQIPAGNIRRQPLAKIWRNAPLLAKIRALRARDFKQCLGCSLEKYCFRCMGLAYLETGRYANKAEIFCMMAKAVQENLKVIRRQSIRRPRRQPRRGGGAEARRRR